LKKTLYRIRLYTATICAVVMLFNFLAGITYSYRCLDGNPADEEGICFFHNIINPCEHYDQIFKIAFVKYKNLMINSANHCSIHIEFANTIKEIATPSEHLVIKEYSRVFCFVNSSDFDLILKQYFRIFHPPKSTEISIA
jgi:hypothetical protein